MNVEAQELADQIRAMARIIQDTADKMADFAATITEPDLWGRAVELEGAACVADEWAKAIEKQYCRRPRNARRTKK